MNSKRVARELEFFNATHFVSGRQSQSYKQIVSERLELSAHFFRALVHKTEDVKDIVDAAARAMVMSESLSKGDQSVIACAFVTACAGVGKNPDAVYASQVLNKIIEEKPEVEDAVIAAFLLPPHKAPATYTEVRDRGTGNIPKISPY